VGTGWWLLADLAERVYQCSGIEVNPWNLERARQRLPDLAILEGSIEDADLPEETSERDRGT
jgi:hypothetical protein